MSDPERRPRRCPISGAPCMRHDCGWWMAWAKGKDHECAVVVLAMMSQALRLTGGLL